MVNLNLTPVINLIDKQKDELIKALQVNTAEYEKKIEEKVRKKLKDHFEKNIKKLEKLKLSKNNVEEFIKLAKLIDEIENSNNLPSVEIFAERHNIDRDSAETLIFIVRCSKIYEKIVQSKAEVFKYF